MCKEAALLKTDTHTAPGRDLLLGGGHRTADVQDFHDVYLTGYGAKRQCGFQQREVSQAPRAQDGRAGMGMGQHTVGT